jgi:pimeloyl-ACP methyl ester carboxylesterase
MNGNFGFAPWVERTSSRLASRVDDLFCSAALNPPKLMRARSAAESLVHTARMRALSAIGAFYARDAFLASDSEFFPKPPDISPLTTQRRSLGKQGEVVDLTWPTSFTPLWSSSAASELLGGQHHPAGSESDLRALQMDRSGELSEKYQRAKRNQTCHARWYRHHGGGRPCAVILHGYMAGSYAIEERIWDVPKLFRQGIDVVISVLPFHGPRRSEKRGYLPPAFPSSDPRFTIEGFRQLVCDQRALFAYLRSQGVTDVGVMGMSLGGYAAALLATLESDLSFLVLFIPLASIEDFAQKHGRLTGSSTQQAEQYLALRAAQRVVSPLARPPLIDSNRVLVLEGASDLVTGPHHAEQLAKHFGAKTVRFSGGHLLHFGRAQAFRAVYGLLRELALTNDPAH